MSILQQLGTAVAAGLFAIGSFFGGFVHLNGAQDVKLGSVSSFNPVQAAPTTLSGSGITTSDTTINLTSLKTRQGYAIQTADIGGIGYATIDPGTVKEENISFTTITQNANGTAQITGVTRGLNPVYPYAASTTLAYAHSGGATVILSNSAAFYGQFNIAANTSTITGNWTFSSSSIPQLASNTTYAQVIANNNNLVNYATLASTSIAGGIPASRTNAGIVKIATSSDLANGVTTSTYELVAPAEAFSSSSNTGVNFQVPVAINGVISSGFIPTAGSSTYVLFNDSNKTSATSSFTFTSSSQQLALNNGSSSLIIGNNFNSLNTASSASFSYAANATTSWTVPAGVQQITVSLNGAAGAADTGGGGSGGSVTGTISVTPGTTYYLCVGGAGVNGGCGGAASGGGSGAGGGGKGGGMTWFSTASSFATSSVLFVAGGGGGGANNAGGGFGGGTTAGTGGNGNSGSGGSGGSQSAGGSGGAGGGGGATGSTGSAGTGGQGGLGSSTSGGGGGGGYFGGGGGGGSNTGGSGGGGGGSSFISSLAVGTSSATSTTSGNGSLTINYNIVSAETTSSLALAVGGHILNGGGEPNIGNCGVNASVAGSDGAGLISVGTGVVTSCSLTFAHSWITAPVCTVSDNSTSITPDISSVSTTSVTFGFSATIASGKVYYICQGY